MRGSPDPHARACSQLWSTLSTFLNQSTHGLDTSRFPHETPGVCHSENVRAGYVLPGNDTYDPDSKTVAYAASDFVTMNVYPRAVNWYAAMLGCGSTTLGGAPESALSCIPTNWLDILIKTTRTVVHSIPFMNCSATSLIPGAINSPLCVKEVNDVLTEMYNATVISAATSDDVKRETFLSVLRAQKFTAASEVVKQLTHQLQFGYGLMDYGTALPVLSLSPSPSPAPAPAVAGKGKGKGKGKGRGRGTPSPAPEEAAAPAATAAPTAAPTVAPTSAPIAAPTAPACAASCSGSSFPPALICSLAKCTHCSFCSRAEAMDGTDAAEEATSSMDMAT